MYNIIPSISAITGVSPQRYLWRISVAFHIGPRIIIAAVSKSYHINRINKNADFKVWYFGKRAELYVKILKARNYFLLKQNSLFLNTLKIAFQLRTKRALKFKIN